MRDVKRLNADTFAAFSYPPDTMMISDQARASNFNPKVFYTAVGTAFPVYKQRFGADVEGVMGIGGWNPDAPESKNYIKRHMEATGQKPDGWASPITYASLQMLQQAIERVGKVDRAAVIKELQTGTLTPSSARSSWRIICTNKHGGSGNGRTESFTGSRRPRCRARGRSYSRSRRGMTTPTDKPFFSGRMARCKPRRTT